MDEMTKKLLKTKLVLCSNPKSDDKKKYILSGKIIEIKNEGNNTHYDCLILDEKERKICCRLANNAIVEDAYYKPGKEICAIVAQIKTGAVHLFILDSIEKKHIYESVVSKLENNTEIEKGSHNQNAKINQSKDVEHNFPIGFYSLPQNVKDDIRNQLKAKKYFPVERKKRTDNLSELRLKYEICRNTYPEETQRTVDRMLEQTVGYDSSRNQKTKDKLKYILQINTAYTPEKVKAIEMKYYLDETFYGLNTAKEEVISAINMSNRCNEHGLKILLVGPPGCGKTMFAKSIAYFRGKPYNIMSCANITSVVDAAGDSSHYDSAKPGRIGEVFYECGTTDMTLILDEYDKMTHGNYKDGDADTIFTDMLGNGFYYDINLEAKFDTSNTWFIATCNYEEDIAPHILNRFDKIIYIPPYTENELLEIAKHYIIPILNNKYNLEKCTFLNDDILQYIISNYCYDSGCRNLISALSTLYLKTIENHCDIAKIVLEKSDVDSFLDRESKMNDSIASYYTNRKKFDKEDQKKIEKIIDLSNSKNSKYGGNEKKDRAKYKLDLIANFCNTRKLDYSFNYDEFMIELDKRHSGMNAVKKALARTVNYLLRTGKGKNLLLVGPPGTGKTTILKSMADTVGLPFAKISCNGITSKAYIKGTPSNFSDADCGAIVNAVSITGDTAIIMLDEIDKIGINMEYGYDILSAFLDLLDEKHFHDMFLDIKFNLEKIIFVATANNQSNISPEMLDRFEIVEVEGYSKEEKKSILKNYILPNVLNDANCDDNSIRFNEEVIEFIIDNYTETAGVRELKRNVEKIVGDIILKTNTYTVEIDDVIEILGKPSIKRGNLPNKYIPGTVNGLSVNTYSGLGNMFAISAINSKNDKQTGLAQGSLLESIDIAKAVASQFIPECEDKHYHIHFAEGGIKKDGPSAGVAITIAILSCELDIPINNKYAYTGEIDLMGNVWGIGGTIQKIEAAIDNGCVKVFIPTQNYEQLEKLQIDRLSNKIDIVPISNIRDVVEIVFSKKIIKYA